MLLYNSSTCTRHSSDHGPTLDEVTFFELSRADLPVQPNREGLLTQPDVVGIDGPHQGRLGPVVGSGSYATIQLCKLEYKCLVDLRVTAAHTK